MRKVILAILVLLIVGAGLALKSNLLKIRKEEIIKNGISCDDGNLEKTLDLKGSNILTVKTQVLEEKVAKKYLCIKDISFQKTFPNKLIVTLNPRMPAALVRIIKDATSSAILLNPDQEATPSTQSAFIEELDNGKIAGLRDKLSASFLADDKGLLYSQPLPGVNIPEILFLGEKKLGESMSGSSIPNFISITKKLADLSISWKNAVLDGDDLLVTADDPPKIFFNLSDDVSRQLASLQLILQKSKINPRESGSLQSVDLRYDKPVVIYAPKKR